MKDYLSHHGVLGMKWGVRRFQNKDGSLTSKGRNRYSKKRSSSVMSNAELKSRINRLKLENEYNSLEKQKKSSVAKGVAAVVGVLTTTALLTSSIVNIGKNSKIIMNNGKKVVDKVIKV